MFQVNIRGWLSCLAHDKPTFFVFFVAVQPTVLLPPPDEHKKYDSNDVPHESGPVAVRAQVLDDLGVKVSINSTVYSIAIAMTKTDSESSTV